MTYFRTGSPYYHRRAAVSRSCSGWEGVGPAGYGRQALKVRCATWGRHRGRQGPLEMQCLEGKEWVVMWSCLVALGLTLMESSRTGH